MDDGDPDSKPPEAPPSRTVKPGRPGAKPGTWEVNPLDIPAVQAILDSAVPLVGRTLGWLGVIGTAFYVRYRGRLFALTAGHCVPLQLDSSTVSLAVPQEGPLGTATVAEIFGPFTFGEDELDLAVMVPSIGPNPSVTRVLELEQAVDLSLSAPRSLYAVGGFPRTGRMSYGDDGTAYYDATKYYVFGIHEGSSLPRCHALRTEEPDEGPDGMSGSPVVGTAYDGAGNIVAALAGMVLMWSGGLLNFLDVRHIIPMVRSAWETLEAEKRATP